MMFLNIQHCNSISFVNKVERLYEFERKFNVEDLEVSALSMHFRLNKLISLSMA